MSGDSVPSSNRMWCTVSSVSLLVHVTVSPAAALTLSGVNAKSLMVTVFVAAAAWSMATRPKTMSETTARKTVTGDGAYGDVWSWCQRRGGGAGMTGLS